jgi:hypothetical protein
MGYLKVHAKTITRGGIPQMRRHQPLLLKGVAREAQRTVQYARS